jgi:cold shock CspA family protein
MRVVKYIPNRLFGFVMDTNDGVEVYFHLGDFDPKGPWPGVVPHNCPRVPAKPFNWTSPPPILGEPVEVILRTPNVVDYARAPKASRVTRIEAPVFLHGQVDSFNPQHGYGFVNGSDGVSYYLHVSEMLEGHFPKTGDNIMFFAGSKQGKNRACHAHICEM